MSRLRIFLLMTGFLASCTAYPTLPQHNRISQTDQDLLSREIDLYSTYAIAKYAGLTEDIEVSAANYIKLLEDFNTDPWIAEQAVYAVLRLGDMPTALRLAKTLPEATLAKTELPRLTLAIGALKEGDNLGALQQLRQRWYGRFHSILARSLAAWVAFETDPETAIALQSRAGQGDTIYQTVGQILAALMKASLGREAEALEDLDQLWQERRLMAMGVETQARLTALKGNKDAALSYLSAFRQTIGRHPALIALTEEIKTDQITPFAPLSQQEGAARLLYLATAPQTSRAYGDISIVYFTLANYLDPDFHAIHTLWADALDQSDRRPEAIALLKSIPPSSVHHTSAQGQLAWALRREGRDEEALQTARTTLMRTNNRNIRVQLADLLQTLDQDGEAEAIFTNIIDQDEIQGEYDWRVYFARGAARERLGIWPLAESDLKTALSLNPESAMIMNHLGYSWIDRGLNLDDGLALIQKALALEPMSGAITDSLGWAYYKLGQFEKSVRLLEQATTLMPDESEILDHLGDAYWQLGRFKEAGYQWQRALKYAQDTETRERLEQKLSTGLTLSAAQFPQLSRHTP